MIKPSLLVYIIREPYSVCMCSAGSVKDGDGCRSKENGVAAII